MKNQTEEHFKSNKELGVCVVLLDTNKFAKANCYYEQCIKEYQNLDSCIGWKWTPNFELENPDLLVEEVNSGFCSTVGYKK